MNILMCTR